MEIKIEDQDTMSLFFLMVYGKLEKNIDLLVERSKSEMEFFGFEEEDFIYGTQDCFELCLIKTKDLREFWEFQLDHYTTKDMEDYLSEDSFNEYANAVIEY